MLNGGMRVLVTGASGFVGRHAVTALAAAGAEVHAVCRTPPPGDCVWRMADLLVPGQARAVVEAVRPDAVLHLAWCVGHGVFWTDPANRDWKTATLALASAAADCRAARFVGVGTCYEYDWPADGDCIEQLTPLAGHTVYDRSKRDCHKGLESLCAGSGMALVWGRLFFLYGDTEDPRRLVGAIARALVRGEPVDCSRGLAVRDYVDVADAGAALSTLVLSDAEGPFNIGSGHGVRVADLATALGRLAGRPDLIRLGALPDRPGEPPRIVADTTRLRQAIGGAPASISDNRLTALLRSWAVREAPSIVD